MKTYDITINGEPAVVDERRVVDALTHGDVRAFTTQADTCFAIAKSEDARDALVSIGGGGLL